MEVTSLQQTNLQQTILPQSRRRLRLLVAIASYGDKNIEFLKRIIRNYRNMDMEVAIFVLSEAPKDLGRDVNVLVGLPSRNPWSLPFAHKGIFADNLDRYDLFAYSEDDMEVTEKHIQAFLRVTPELGHDEIAGFLRYETNPSGIYSFPEAHGSFHWKAETVRQRGPNIVAEFSNEHAGFYLLTQAQLRKAIASGGFLKQPYESRYDMLCSAATDPYTSCGFRKVICISALKEFAIHHLPNRYVGQFGLPILSFTEQIQTLIDICEGVHPRTSLCETESKILHGRWSKSFYEDASDALLELVPRDVKTILSIGCGWGATEVAFKQRGAKVTALPLDSVIGSAAERLGIEVIYGNLAECFEKVGGRKFQCLLITNLLHLLPDPGQLLDRLQRLVLVNGVIVITGPNFDFYKILIKRALGRDHLGHLGDFGRSGINLRGPATWGRILLRAGFQIEPIRWFRSLARHDQSFRNRAALCRWTARDWSIVARNRSSAFGCSESA